MTDTGAGAAPSPTNDLPRQLAVAVAELAEDLNRAPSQDVTADSVCAAAVKLLGPCDGASITMRVGRHSFQTVGTSNEYPRQLDAQQYELREGPCIDVAADRVDAVVSNDLRTDERWPRWGPLAVNAGQLAILSAPLLAGTRRRGAVNFYSSRLDAWSEEDLDLALLFTAHAALPLSYAHEIAGLTTAISNRHTIGVAQGMIMRDYDIDLDTSFNVLQTLSSEQNIKIQELARRIVEGDAPASGPSLPDRQESRQI